MLGGKQDHVLLAAAVGHLEQVLESFQRLAQVTAGEDDVGAVGAGDGVGRRNDLEIAPVASGQDGVSHRFPGDAFRFDDQGLDNGIG